MRDAGIGRLAAASLHQAIAELLPARLEFYEGWLSPEGFRNGRVNLAGVRAVLSFLRQEADGAYEAIVRRAGRCAADWSVASMPRSRRAWLRSMPQWVRRRACCRLGRRLTIDAFRESRVTIRWRSGTGRMHITQSLFCDVRAAAAAPLCGFYAAAIERLLDEFSIPAEVHLTQCRATGGDHCAVDVTPQPAHRAGSILAAVLLPVLLATTLAGAQPPVTPRPDGAGRLLVVPFDSDSRDLRLRWLSEASAILLADALDARGVPTISRAERLRSFDRLQVPPLAALSRATVIRVGQLVGAEAVVTGTLQFGDGTLTVSARLVHLDSGRMDAAVTERGPLTDLFPMFDRLAQGLRPGPAGSVAARRDDRPRPPPAAFELYVKGLVAESPSAQISQLGDALKAYAGYDAARLALWHAHTNAGDAGAALKAVEAVPEASALFDRARFLAALSQIALRQHADALTTLTALLKRAPSAELLNNLGVVQLRIGGNPGEGAGRPAWYFNQAREMDPGDEDYLFNLGYAYWLDKDPAAATYWLKEAVRRNPADGAAHAVLAQALQATGAAAEGTREMELAQRLSSAYEGLGRRAPGSESVLRGMERLKDSLGPPRGQDQGAETALEAGGQREQRELATIYLERGRRLFAQEHDREAAAELQRVVYLSPYQADAHLLLGRIYLRTGRLRDAIDAFKISLWSEESAAAHVALAEAYVQAKDDTAARAEALRALEMDPNATAARDLLARLAVPRGGQLPL